MATPLNPRENNGRQLQSNDIFAAMRAEIERMFDRFTASWPMPAGIALGESGAGAIVPIIDLKDTGTAIIIEAELPGVDEKDVSITVQNRILTIKGEKRQSQESKDENHFVMERSYGSFVRSIPLPETVDEDSVGAHFENGVLKITASKRPDAAQPEKRIEIKKV